MAVVRKYMKFLFVILVLCVIGYGFIVYYPYIFAKTVDGKVERIERIQLDLIVQGSRMANQRLNPELYSFAVAIKTADNQIHTASTEDRQWAAVSPGVCVKAKFFPYPPWALDKAGTFYGARLLESRVCD